RRLQGVRALPARPSALATASVWQGWRRERVLDSHPATCRRVCGRVRLQVPPLLLAVRVRRTAQVRARPRLREGRLAHRPLQPLVARRSRRGMTAMLVFSVLQPLENAVRWLLERFHYNVGLPWAWAIVATTVVVRIILVPLTVRQIHSMQSLQKHAPEMKEIQRKYKGDRQKLNEELMKFYKENHINPAASCLPLLAQFPVFIALYFVLRKFSKNPPSGSLSWLHIVPSIAAKADSHWSGFVLLAIAAAGRW